MTSLARKLKRGGNRRPVRGGVAIRPRIAAPDLSTMVRLEGGVFAMGSDRHYPEEAPARRVRVSPFWIDRYPVTNADFARFVTATGYRTMAERPLDPKLYPGADPAQLQPGSLVFQPTAGPVDLRNFRQWWAIVPGAAWHCPEGPGSSIEGMADHPVVHVAYEDAMAYATWCGKTLPTEAMWEFAARGGLDDADYAWGDVFEPDGRHMANTWHGRFPYENTAADGYTRSSPVGAFPPNGYGLYDMTGNVWEWTTDWYTDRHAPDAAPTAKKPCCIPSDPRGGAREGSFDPFAPELQIPRKVAKGGSFLCTDQYCIRYRPAARQGQAVDTTIQHLGFRCAVMGEKR
jgi:formylglycine-generating enzyme required for sulfatase activity